MKMKRRSIEILSKLAVVLLFVLNKNVGAKETNQDTKDGKNTLISHKEWFEWVSDPTSKCEKYGDKLLLGTFT